MNQSHDPVRQANYLRQCLAQEKRPLGLFLAGGCPMAIKVHVESRQIPLIPGIDGITKAVKEELKASPHNGPFDTVCAHFEADGRGEPTVEDLLTHIRSLRHVAGSEAVRGVKAL